MTTTNTDTSTAFVILEQLGGNKFVAMTGASLVATVNGLQLKLPSYSRASCVAIKLESDGTYTVQAYRGRGNKMCAYGETVSMVYADSLRRVFESLTGLYTS